MPYFRKKPVVIEARQVPHSHDGEGSIAAHLEECVELAEWCGGRSYMMHSPGDEGEDHILIPTLEGEMMALPGDYIIRRVKGEFYPIKEEIFLATYEPAGE